MKKNSMTYRLYLMYVLALIPLILFGLYKNGLYLYQKNYADTLSALKPLIIIFMGVGGAFFGSCMREYSRTRKFDFSFIDKSKDNLIEGLILAMILPIRTSPLVIFLTTFTFSIFFKKIKFNRIAIMYLIIALFNKLVGIDGFENAYEMNNVLNYNGLDLFVGRGVGGICSTNILLVTLGLIYLSFNKIYKKDLAIYACVTFILLGVIPNMISGEYTSIFKVIFSYNVLFAFVFVAPNLYSSSYTTKGQTLSGVVLGVLTYFLMLIWPYNGVMVAILLVNLLNGIFDRIFVIK